MIRIIKRVISVSLIDLFVISIFNFEIVFNAKQYDYNEVV